MKGRVDQAGRIEPKQSRDWIAGSNWHFLKDLAFINKNFIIFLLIYS